jgi:hypothetical protein
LLGEVVPGSPLAVGNGRRPENGPPAKMKGVVVPSKAVQSRSMYATDPSSAPPGVVRPAGITTSESAVSVLRSASEKNAEDGGGGAPPGAGSPRPHPGTKDATVAAPAHGSS